MGPVKKLWRSKKLSGASRMRGRVIMCRYNPSLITIHCHTFYSESGARLMMTKVNETSLAGVCSACISAWCRNISWSAITIVYWVFTHSITPPPAWPSRVIYQVRGPGLGFNARSMQIIRGYGGRRTQDTRVSNYLETTLNIAHRTSLLSSLGSSLWSSPGAG